MAFALRSRYVRCPCGHHGKARLRGAGGFTSLSCLVLLWISFSVLPLCLVSFPLSAYLLFQPAVPVCRKCGNPKLIVIKPPSRRRRGLLTDSR